MCYRRGRDTVATITFITSRLNRYVRWIFENMQEKLAEVIFLIKKELKIYKEERKVKFIKAEIRLNKGGKGGGAIIST